MDFIGLYGIEYGKLSDLLIYIEILKFLDIIISYN